MSVGTRFRPDYDNRTLTVGDRTVPCRVLENRDAIDWPVRRARVEIGEFEFSIVWGAGTYSDNYDAGNGAPFEDQPFTVEVMTMRGNVGDDAAEPRGWQSVTDVLALLDKATP